MQRVALGWDEFWAELFRIKHRNSIPGIEQYDRMVVEFCIDTLGLEPGREVLDIACGAGVHSIEFAKAGLKATAFDLAESLVRAGMQRAQEEGVEVDFYTGDMREMDYHERFHAAVILSHSFGFFDHEGNMAVLRGAYNALRAGGRLLLDLMNPYNLPRFHKTWTKVAGGYLLNEAHVLDAASGILRGRPATFIDVENARIVVMNEDAMMNNNIRMYTAHEIRELLADTGFNKVELYGQNKLPRTPYSADSQRMVVVAEK